MIAAQARSRDRAEPRALVLHIGHHKTATSYLQKFVFTRLQTLSYAYKRSTPLSAELIDTFSLSPQFWVEQGERFFQELSATLDDEPGAQSRGWLVSSEAMSSHRIFADPSRHEERRDPYLMAAQLAACGQKAKQHGFALRVILCFRRQDQYFPSRFASIGRRVGPVCQYNFEQQMNAILDSEKRYYRDGVWFDYYLSWQLISEALGENSLLMLPQELLAEQPERYFQALCAFLGEPELAAALKNDRSENRRSLSPDCWKLQRRGFAFLLERLLARLGVDPETVVPRNTLHLTPELKARIIDCYRSGNQALASALGIDLATFGYW
ncbi:MAG: hypothetical protein VKI83_02995 [Synechococcaceae cyanobacterium]|nr:hypothetical protein [Synechococcaceae cyanobacterium]